MSKWLEEKLENAPLDMDASVKAAIRKSIAEGRAQMLSAEKEAGPFYLYLIGDSYETVAEKTGWSVDVIAITALRFHWYEKKLSCGLSSDDDGAKQVLKSAMSAVLAATAHVLTEQAKNVMSGKIDASECKIIPKSVKELQMFVQTVSQIYEMNEKNEQNQVVNVNIANLPQQQPAVKEEPMKTIDAAPQDRLSKFRLLRESEEKNNA